MATTKRMTGRPMKPIAEMSDAEKPTQATWRRGERYYFVHKATLACSFLSPSMLLTADYLPIYLKRPKDKPEDFHRIRIEVVKTKKEEAAMQAKFAKFRKAIAKKITAHRATPARKD